MHIFIISHYFQCDLITKVWKYLSKKIYELNEGKGFFQEYDNEFGHLIFEGDYINGERNGRGKEIDFWTGKLKYEGEFLKGEKWNVKRYDKNGNVLYEIKNGKGWIKEYDSNKNIIGELKMEKGILKYMIHLIFWYLKENIYIIID